MIDLVFGLGAFVSAFYFGRINGRAVEIKRSAQREEVKRKAEEVLNELPEEGPLLYAQVMRLKKDPPNKLRPMWRHCDKCGWSHELQETILKLCACSTYNKTHFHLKCFECGHRTLIRTRDDCNSVKLKDDANPCECGESQATTDTMSSGAAGWKCTACGKIRPKLVGGVTATETN
jgi:hypothetical protein